MSRHIDILFTGPPAIDFPTYVGAQDENGEPVQVGRWVEPGADLPFWRFRLTPAELLMYLIADNKDTEGHELPLGAVAPIVSGHTESATTPSRNRDRHTPATAPPSDRAALRAKLAGAKPRTGPPPAPAVDPIATEQCPACKAKFNPSLDQLIACSACGEDKCTAKCFDSVADPCLDCQALAADPADPEDVGFEPPPKAEIKDQALAATMQDEARGAKAAVASRLFDNIHHGKSGDSAPDEEEE